MKRFVLAAVAAAFLPAAAQSVTIVNGSFEESALNPGAGWISILAPNSTAIPGWSIDAGSIDYIGTYWTAGEGTRSIDLTGFGFAFGSISQLVADTVAGQSYTVSFLLAKNPDDGETPRTGTFAAGNELFAFSYSTPNDRTNMMWENVSYTFTAEGPTTIQFSADASSECCFGPALDHVRIAPIPEPASWALMLGGFALVGGLLRRRRGAIPAPA